MIRYYLSHYLPKYKITELTSDDHIDVYNLQKSNSHYFSLLNSELTFENCLNGINQVPPYTDISQKFFLGFYNNDTLEAIIDYIEDFPDRNTVYIGFFMVDSSFHHNGIGSRIIESFIESASKCSFKKVRLGVIVCNTSGVNFWSSLGFKELKRVPNLIEDPSLDLLIMEWSI